MKLLAGFRRRQAPVARAIVVLFAASWLGLAMQPCVAGHLGDRVHDAGVAGHHGAPAPDAGAGHDCPHCPPKATEGHDCGTGVALECDAIGVPVLPSKDSDSFSWLPDLLPAGEGIRIDLDAGRPGTVGPRQAPWRPPDRPLQQRFCTYLK